MDSQLYILINNNVSTPIDQSNICYVISSGPLVSLSNDANSINPADEYFINSEELICNYVEEIPNNEEEFHASGLPIPIIDGFNEIFMTYNETESSKVPSESFIIPTSDAPNTENSYMCEHCGIKFQQIKLLNRHKMTHVYEKPFKCNQCYESFNFSVNLKVHSTFHQDPLVNSGRQEHKCSVCNKIFRRLSSLRGHLKGHLVSDYFNCDHCNEMFLAKPFYEDHLDNYHKKVDMKTIIDKLPSGNNVSNIERNCNLCGKFFKKPSMLVRHMRVHNGEKPFRCGTCGKQFSQNNSLKTHMFRHSGKKPFACTLCSMRFAQKGNLKIHKDKVHNKFNSNTEDTKYPCNKCSCVFRKIGSLNRHITEVHSINKKGMVLNEEINFNEIISQISDLRQATPASDASEQGDGIIQLADRLENGILIHRKVQHLGTNRGKKMLSCLNCGKLFTRPSDLLRHIRVHTKEKPYECYLCKRRFSVQRTLSLHYKTHESALRKFSCCLCSKNFRDITTLLEHGTEYHQNCGEYLQCFQCKMIFTNAEQLETHSKEHNRRLATTNRKSYNTRIQMQDPIVINQEIKHADTRRRLYKCNDCSKRFIKLCHLKQHQLSHTGDRPFSCDKCIKTFKSRNALTIHTRSHTNLKPYKCDKCEEHFVSMPILKRHCLTHSEVRNFICPYCKKPFKSNSDCRKHIRVHQKEIEEPSIERDVCPSAQVYISQVQPSFKTCRYCNRYFKKPIDLRRHERVHTGERPFNCDKCDKSFSLASTLKLHQRIHDEFKRMFTCHVCSNKYATKGSLKVHKRIHTGEKPFNCRFCDAKFRTNGHRSVHESSHIKIAYERGIDPKDVKNMRSSKFENIVENFTFN